MLKDNTIKDIEAYCEANNIDDVWGLINKMVIRGFSIEKFGETPSKSQDIPEVVEKEVIKEVIKEVPFEVVKEVEVIKEVEKIVNVADDVEINKLLKKIDELETSHKEDIELFKENRKAQTQQIMKLNKEKDILQEKLDSADADCKLKLAEKDKEITKLKSRKDFYGE